MNIPRAALLALAEDAMRQERLLKNNPVEITRADALALYENAF
ncbi:iron-containing alcohol dehydrogenase [Sinorhizobium meliloti]|nr:iron-containing alcohol dehydrogenase [Sinorhizobium meliloti]